MPGIPVRGLRSHTLAGNPFILLENICMFLLGFDSLKMNRTFFGRGLFLVFFLVFSRYFVLAWFSFSVILTILSPLFLSKYLFLLGFHFYLTWGLLGLPRWFSGLRLHAPSAEAQV